jgi:DNA (cytosine-5)-methyltransferase 1
MAEGLGDDSRSHWFLEDDGVATICETRTEKPPYRVPSMAEIRAVSKTFTVASLFAGCGGSCCGYEMAGGRVLWANELDAHARECHAANFPDCEMDSRDVRDVRPEDLLSACGLEEGELDVLDGSPPCQTFSTAGKRRMTDKQSDLFFEFARILGRVRPRVFVAENVSGLVKGVAKGYFLDILADLKSRGYRVRCCVLDAQWLGVPQRRQRCIFVGVREDLELEPRFPAPLPWRYSIAEACPWITRAEHDETGQWSEGDVTHRPSPTIRAGSVAVLYSNGGYVKDKDVTNSVTATQCRLEVEAPCVQATHGEASIAGVMATSRRKFTIGELKRVCSFPNDFTLTGSYAKQWARLGNSVPPVMMFHVASRVRETLEEPRGRHAN